MQLTVYCRECVDQTHEKDKCSKKSTLGKFQKALNENADNSLDLEYVAIVALKRRKIASLSGLITGEDKPPPGWAGKTTSVYVTQPNGKLIKDQNGNLRLFS
jgi:hypothetical protein